MHTSREGRWVCVKVFVFVWEAISARDYRFEVQEANVSLLIISDSRPVFSLALKERRYVVKVAALPFVQPQAEREVELFEVGR